MYTSLYKIFKVLSHCIYGFVLCGGEAKGKFPQRAKRVVKFLID